ncbi:iron chelate uptake ABC transporter family permease subunit [Sinorhizobium sp. RAC02]|uniref:FecCD family ABC transporter permease n=1 Tax=Sinorhizobium sp. RAC02 TaxID=1842534 RepID=UPI00085677FC|nr:iron chelate uptake ABC transporter family permease subunit [Sinorhizobium sp. RAC02]AOF93881.1 fecCD transport family protein [Sinorhizobium sp. RAC02]
MSSPPIWPDFRRRMLPIRILGDRLSRRLDGRALLAGSLILFFAIGLAGVSLATGYYPVTPAQVATAFLQPDTDVIRMIVVEWRLPRVGLAFLLGGALGLSGAIFQSLTRNPLGSPDIIGFSAGSYTGALAAILLLSGGYYETAAGALVGGIVTALAVYLFAYRRGVQGFRLIIVGIGVSAMLGALNAWMIREADLQVAMSAAIWGAGSLNGLGIDQLLPVLLVLALLVPPMLVLARPMRQLEMGDDAARASGVNAGRVRLSLMVLGVALTATVTAAAGPIAFIALAAPQIARRLIRSPGVTLLPSALVGALLLTAADWAAQHAFSNQLPVGMMTVSIGGFYFLWLLVREGRT